MPPGTPLKIELDVDEELRGPGTSVPDRRPRNRRPHQRRRRRRGLAPARIVRRRARPASGRARPAVPQLHVRRVRARPVSNRFAHAAAMAVAEAPPSKAYNPLFIYGGVGLGKTHLLIAVGHHMHRLNPASAVKYVTSEQFVTEFIKAVRERQGDSFRQRYREVDVLLVDDIQFLAKREETQTEFFHTFNHLHGGRPADRDRVRPAAARAVRHGGAPGQPLPLGTVRRRAASRTSRRASRSCSSRPSATTSTVPARRGRVRGVEVRPERARARGRPGPRRRVVASSRASRST